MGRLTARWGAALRIARRDATRHKGRTALVLAMIALPVLGAVLIGTVLRSSVAGPEARVATSLGPQAQARVSDSGCLPFLQTPDGSGVCLDPSDEPLTADDVESVIPDGVRLAEQRVAALSVSASDRLASRQAVTELPGEALGAVFVADEGVLPGNPEEVAIGSRLASRLGVATGDSIVLRAADGDVEVRVVGILRSRNAPSADVVAVAGTVPETSAVGWFVLGDAPVTWDDVVALNEVGADVDSRAVQLDPPPASAVPAYEYVGQVTLRDNLASVGLVGAVAAIALLEVVLLIGPAFAVGARRSTRQLALLAASGGAPKDVRRVVLASGLVLGFAAGVIGAGTGLVLGAAFYAVAAWRGEASLPNLVLPWLEVGAGVALATILGVAASWIPARGAARADVVAALAGRRAEAEPRRAVPWVGVSVAVIGLAGAVVGAVTTQVVALVAGVIVLEIGLVMASGGLVALVGGVAGRLGLAGRLAARDAARQRGRTAPAVAAVLAAVAGATAGVLYFSADQAREEAAWEPQLGIGSVALSSMTYDGSVPEPDQVADDLALLERTIPLTGAADVYLLGVAPDPVAPDAQRDLWVSPDLAPQHRCPLPEDATAQEMRSSGDPRCTDGFSWTSGGIWGGRPGVSSTVVDDGTAVAFWGLPGAQEAAAALQRGEVLVADERLVRDDGTVQVRVSMWDAGSADESIVLGLPAHVVDWGRYTLILPASVVDQYDELTPVLAGAVGQPVELPTEAQVDTVAADLDAAGGGWLYVQEPYSTQVGIVLLVIVGVAAFIGLGATWMSVGLAAAESRPDLATLAAVGASPRTRRRVAGAQAGIVAVLGVGLGVVTGVLLGWVLVLWQASNAANVYDDQGDWLLVWPWPALVAIAVGIPLLAVAGAWLTTPSRLPLARRLAQ